MTTIYHTKIQPTGFAATSSAVGYPASNVAKEDIIRAWKGGGLGAIDVTLTWPVQTTLAALMLEDVNFAAATIQTSTDAVAFAGANVLTSYADKQTGRRRALIVLNTALARGVRIQIGAGASTDGATAWRIGAAYLFNLAAPLARNENYGRRVRSTFPKVSKTLPNGRKAQASTGPDFLSIALPFSRRYDQDLIELVRRARAGTIGLSLDDVDYPEFTFPAYYTGEGLEEDFARLRQSDVTLELDEVT